MPRLLKKKARDSFWEVPLGYGGERRTREEKIEQYIEELSEMASLIAAAAGVSVAAVRERPLDAPDKSFVVFTRQIRDLAAGIKRVYRKEDDRSLAKAVVRRKLLEINGGDEYRDYINEALEDAFAEH